MNKKLVTVLSVLVIIAFVAYIILDTAKPSLTADDESIKAEPNSIPDAWKISTEMKVTEGQLKAVAVEPSGKIFLGGDSFVSCYDKDMKLIWNIKTPSAVTSLSNCGDTVFASTNEQILVMNSAGRILNEYTEQKKA